MAKTVRKKEFQLSDFQLTYEKIMQIAAFVLAVIHMTLVPFRYAVDYKLFQPYERWFGFILSMAAVIYLFITKIQYSNSWFRVAFFLKKFSTYEQKYMVFLLLWFVISCMNRQSITGARYLHSHDWFIFDMAVNIMILLPMAKFFGKDKAKRAFELIIHVVVGTYTVFTFWALWNVFRLKVITLPGGGQIGMNSKTKLFLGCHYNLTGAIALTMLALCLYMIFTKHIILKIVYTIAAVSHLIVSMLSNSRTVFVAGLTMMIVAAFMYGWNRFADREQKMRIGISAGLAFLCGMVFWLIRPMTFALFEHITHFKELIGSNQVIADDVRELTNLNGRLKIWTACLKVMFSSLNAFFFGVTPGGVTYAMIQYGGLTKEYAHAHNAILQVGVAFGVPAMIGFIGLYISIFLRSLQILFSQDETLFKHAYIVPVVVLCLVVMNLAEAYLVGYYSIMSSVFFLFCGWVIEMSEKPNISVLKLWEDLKKRTISI